MSTPSEKAASVHRIGHLGEVGRFFDNLPASGGIIRPRDVAWYRRVIFFMPRWFYAAGIALSMLIGFALGAWAA